MNCDHNLFLALNFDGGPFMDRLMLTVSGTTMWLPLYALILWLVWRRDGWRNVILFTALMIETDAPYLTPRGYHLPRTNVPQNITYVAETLARYMQVRLDPLLEAAKKNTEDFFHIKS